MLYPSDIYRHKLHLNPKRIEVLSFNPLEVVIITQKLGDDHYHLLVREETDLAVITSAYKRYEQYRYAVQELEELLDSKHT